MTNNEKLKEDTTELFNKLMTFQKKHRNVISRGVLKGNDSFQLMERDLRMMLQILRTDEENNEQFTKDCLC
jgi:hypothetical protein